MACSTGLAAKPSFPANSSTVVGPVLSIQPKTMESNTASSCQANNCSIRSRFSAATHPAT